MNDNELTRVDDYEGALSQGKSDYMQAKKLFRKVLEKSTINDTATDNLNLMIKQLDYIIAFGLIQSVNEWEETLSTGHINFLNDLFEDGNLEEYCCSNGIAGNWANLKVKGSSLKEIEQLLVNNYCFDNIAKLFISYNSTVYGIKDYQQDPRKPNVAYEFFSNIVKLTVYFCTLNPDKGFNVQNIQGAQQKFEDYYAHYIYEPSLMGVKYFYIDNSCKLPSIKLNANNPNMNPELLTFYAPIVDTVKDLSSNSRFYENVLELDNGQDAFDQMMPAVDMIIQLIIFKTVIADKIFTSKEKEFLKNSTNYGDLLKNLNFDINWDDLYDYYPESGTEIENNIDLAISEDGVVDYFTNVILPSILTYLGLNTLSALKVNLMGINCIAAGVSGKTGTGILGELNTGTFLINDYLWGKCQETLHQLGIDVQI